MARAADAADRGKGMRQSGNDSLARLRRAEGVRPRRDDANGGGAAAAEGGEQQRLQGGGWAHLVETGSVEPVAVEHPIEAAPD